MVRGLVAVVAALPAGDAGAQAFDPATVRAEVAGPPTEVLVLGTAHLSGMPASFAPEHLAPVLDRLAAWKPDAISIEALSGPQCDELRRYDAFMPGTAKQYCWDPAAAQEAVGFDMAAATIEAARLLKAWPAAPTPAQRRRLAAVFLAGGERASALVQWLRLPADERRAGDGLSADMAALLAKGPTQRNEDYLLAAALAARLGLERVYPTDDHTADLSVPDEPGYGEALQRIWKGAAAKRLAANKAEEAKLGTPAGTLGYYRYLNAPDQPQVVFDSDFGAALNDRTPELYGRRYAAWWEVRNLRMVANIRAIAVPRPGMRVLAVVGASHRGYFEAYLRQMHDVRVADIGAVLR